MNMKKLITLAAMATTMIAIGANTFESIPFNQPTFSEADPLGVTAITTAQSTAAEAKTTATEAKQKATALETTIAETVQKGQLTNDVVVVGNAKGANGAGMESTTTSIVFAVNRDIDELDAANGEILFSADKVRFDVGLNSILFGNQTLNDLIGAAGSGGELNVIEGITVNGATVTPVDKIVALTIPEGGQNNVIEAITTNGISTTIGANKTVDIVIPAPGDANVIEKITTNGVELAINSKAVEIPLQDYAKLADVQEGFTGKLNAKNGNAFGTLMIGPDPEDPNFVIGLGKVYIDHESVKITNTTQAPDTVYRGDGIVLGDESYLFDNTSSNGIARIKDVSGLTITTAKVTDLDSYKNPTISAAAAQAITDINNANDIATIKSTLTNFLQNFVIQNP